MEGEIFLKKRTSTWLKVTKPLLLSCPTTTCTYFTIFLFFYSISLFRSFFTIYDIFHNILFLNNARDTTNFTTYVLQIGMSPVIKNNF